MNEEKKELEWYKKAWDTVKKPETASQILSTSSAFLSALVLYVIVSGVEEGFSWSVLWDWKSLAVMFLGGLGIVFVQEDGMLKGLKSFLKRDDVQDYNKENKRIQDKIVIFDFKHKFIRDKNEENLKILKEDYKIVRTHELNMLIEDELDQTKKKEYEKELKRLEKGNIKLSEINYEPYEINDIFSLNAVSRGLGKDEFKDNSNRLQRKSNVLARIYSPIIMLLITTVLGSLTDNAVILFLSSFAFLLLLGLQWFLSYQKTINLKVEITLPILQTKNTKLKEAERQYDVEYPSKKELQKKED